MATNTQPKSPGPKKPAGGNNSGRSRSIKDEYGGTPLSMTSIRANLLHSRLIQIVLCVLIAIFAITLYYGPTAGGLGSMNGNNHQGGGPGPDPVASVGGQAVSRRDFEAQVEQQSHMMEEFGEQVGPAELLGIRERSLGNATDEAARYDDALSRGITASDAEIDKKIDSMIDDQIKSNESQFGGEASFRRQIETKWGSMEAFRDEQRKNYIRPEIAKEIVLDKLEKQIKNEVKVTEADYKKSVTKLKLRQIVVRAKLPSPTEKDFKAAQVKNASDALLRAQKIYDGLKLNPTPANFTAVATKQSDDITTRAAGGELGYKLPSDLTVSQSIKDALPTATSNLVGPLRDEVSNDYYIFLIEDRQVNLPKDYATKKKDDIAAYRTQKQNDAWQAYQDALKKRAKVDILDPELTAYKLQTEQIFTLPADQQTKARQDALAKYQEALAYGSEAEHAAIEYQMSQLYRDLKQPDKQIEALREVVKDSATDTTSRIELARALADSKKTNDAVHVLQSVSQLLDHPAAPSPNAISMGGGSPTDAIRSEVAMLYDQLGKKDMAASERQKIKPPSAPPSHNMVHNITIPGH